MTFPRTQPLAIPLDLVVRQVGLAAEFRHRLSIHRNQTAGDQLFGLPTRGDSGSGNDLLQALSRHGRPRYSLFAVRSSPEKIGSSFELSSRAERSLYLRTR